MAASEATLVGNKKNMLAMLAGRGDRIAIENGRLHITPASGATIPAAWLQTYGPALEQEIISMVGVAAYRYDCYSTGRYKVGNRTAVRKPGVTLQLSSILGDQSAYSIFNANLDRARGPNKGKPLPKGQFRVGTRHAFYHFWIRTGLAVPPRHKLYDYLGNLRALILTGEADSNGRIPITDLRPLTLRWEALSALIPPPISRLTPAQLPPNCRPILPPNEVAADHTGKGLHVNSDAGLVNHDKKVIRKTNTRDRSSVLVDPIEQSVEEWLIAHDTADVI